PTPPLPLLSSPSLPSPPTPRARHSLPTRRSSDLGSRNRYLRADPHSDRSRDERRPDEFQPRHARRSRAGVREHPPGRRGPREERSEEHTSELQSRFDLVCRLLLEKKNKTNLHNDH